MKTFFKKLIEYFILLVVGGSIYVTMEILFRGYSHISMFIVGGLCLCLIGVLNEFYKWDMYIEWQVLIGVGIILTLEFVSGCIVNLWLDLNVWDYSNMPLNLLGQICLPFALLWIPLAFLAILLDDYLRYNWFGEEKPRYRSIILEKIKLLKK